MSHCTASEARGSAMSNHDVEDAVCAEDAATPQEDAVGVVDAATLQEDVESAQDAVTLPKDAVEAASLPTDAVEAINPVLPSRGLGEEERAVVVPEPLREVGCDPSGDGSAASPEDEVSARNSA